MRSDDDSALRVALDFKEIGKRKRRRPKKTWKKQVEEKIDLKKKDPELGKVERWSAKNCGRNEMNLAIST